MRSRLHGEALCALLFGSALWLASFGAWAQASSCRVEQHVADNGTPFAFGATGVSATAVLSNIELDPVDANTSFRDTNGRLYNTPQMTGRWLLRNSSSPTGVTVTFTPAIPAHRVGVSIVDIGTGTDVTLPPYDPVFTLTVSGGATPSGFVGHQVADLTQAVYTPATGEVRLGARSLDQPVTLRQSVLLRGNTDALVSSLTVTAAGVRNGDHVALALMSIPSCVRIQKVTEHATDSFEFGLTQLSQWNNTAGGPVTLTTSAPGTPATSSRRYYASPIASNGVGTQPVTLTEAIPSGWALTDARCTDANSARNGNTGQFGVLADGVLTIPAERMRFESDITCVFTNTATRADLEVSKTNTPDAGSHDLADDVVLGGTATTYRIAVTNHGPAPADGTRVRDELLSGLTCHAASCGEAAGGAVCPAVDVGTLQGPGVEIQTLPPGGSLVFTMSCMVD